MANNNGSVDLDINIKTIQESASTLEGKVKDVLKDKPLPNEYISAKSKYDRDIQSTISTGKNWGTLKRSFARFQRVVENIVSKTEDLTKEQEEFAKELKKAQSRIEKAQEKLKAESSEKGYSVSDGKVSKLKFEAQGGEDSWQKIFENQQKTKNAILTKRGQKMAWSTFYQKKTKGFDESITSQPGFQVFEKSIKDAIDKANETYQENAAAVKEATEAYQKLVENPPQGSNSNFLDVIQAGNKGLNAIDAELNKENNLKGAAGGVESFNLAINKQQSFLGKAIKAFSIYTLAIRGLKRVYQEGIKTIRELDKYFTEQAMVTGKTRKEIYQLMDTYQGLAAATGATTKEVAQVTTQFLRQGKTVNEALTLTEAAIGAAKVASIDVSSSVNYLTTALNGFRLSSEDAMLVSDKFAAVASKAAVSYEEIAVALSKVASQANLAGMSIDYTTALLAKGIETTRESAESIGTALKTVIARMREMSDYGETLDDGTDINNVETQLAYIDIQLRDTNGELRSTEDVLNDLGAKWDTLNSNQQAAVAKALAGTRQQSRLIAMMSDYERVTELQLIAQRSAGETARQMDTYLEGMEAAMNKVNIAYESIITNLVNSDIVIGIVNAVSGILNLIGKISGNTFGMIAILATIVAISLKIIGQKTKEKKLASDLNKLNIEKEKSDREILKLKIEELKNQYKINIANLEAQLANENISAAEKAAIQAKIEGYKQQIAVAESAQNQLDLQEASLEQRNTLLGQGNNLLSDMFVGLSSITGVLHVITVIMTLQNLLKKRKMQLDKKEEGQLKKNTMWTGLQAFFQNTAHPAGWGVAALIASVLVVIGLGAGIAGLAGAFNSTSNSVAETSKEISNLQDSINDLDTVIDKYEKLDNLIVQTKDDQEALNEALTQASESMSTEEVDKKLIKKYRNAGAGSYADALEEMRKNEQTEQQYYNSLTDQEKKDYIRMKKEAQEQLISEDYNNIEQKIKNGKVQISDIRSSANALVMRHIYNSMNEWPVEEQLVYGSIMQDYVEKLSDSDIEKAITGSYSTISTVLNNLRNNNGAAAYKIMADTNKTVAQRKAAYDSLVDILGEGNSVVDGYDFTFLKNWKEGALNWLDDNKISIEDLQSIGGLADILGLDLTNENVKTEWEDNLGNLFEALNNAKTREEFKAAIDNIINAYSPDEETEEGFRNQLTGLLARDSLTNISQNYEKLSNTVSTLYETAAKWRSMSSMEQMNYIAQNGDLIDENVLAALENGEFEAIRQAVENSEYFKEQIADMEKDLENQIMIQYALGETAVAKELEKRLEELRNGSFIAEQWSSYINAVVEQQNQQLDMFKDMLEKEQEALEESLEKRKEAYQEYFDAVNQSIEDEEYEDNVTTLLTNLTALSSSNNASAANQRADLEKQLEDLEKERIDTLRQRAQEEVINNIDEELEQANKYFEEIRDNSKVMLEAMNELLESNSRLFFGSLFTSNEVWKLTDPEREQFMNNVKAAFPGFENVINDAANNYYSGNNPGSTTNNTTNFTINGTEYGSEQWNGWMNRLYAIFREMGIQVGV